MEQHDQHQKSFSAEPEATAHRVEEFRERLVPHLRAWARHGIHFSLSPWNSPAWVGLLYEHGFRDAVGFRQQALGEYAGCFTEGWLELGPYKLPPAQTIQQMRSQMPPEFGCTVLVTHDVVTYRFPHGHPDPAKRGERNPRFLDPDQMQTSVFPLLQALEPQLRCVVLRCRQIALTEGYPFQTFLRQLDGFLAGLGQTYRVAVEIDTPEYLRPEYFACLQRHGVTPVFCHCESLPPLLEQIQRPEALTSDVVLVRTDAEADETATRRWGVRMDAEMRLGILEAVRRCVAEKKTLYVDLSDRPAGSAPLSLLALMAMLDPDLAKLSPLRKRAA